MRPEIKSTRIEISTSHKRNSIYITFYCGRNEMKIRFAGCPRNTAHSIRTDHSCFDKINAFADVSFCMISFRVMFDCNEITPAMSFI